MLVVGHLAAGGLFQSDPGGGIFSTITALVREGLVGVNTGIDLAFLLQLHGKIPIT